MKMVTVVDEAFTAGKHFIQNFDESMKELRRDIKDSRDLTLDLNKVNLQCVNETNPQYLKTKFLEINGRSNILNLSEELLNKLLSSEKCELTASDINELNLKIKIALRNLKKEKIQQNFLKEEHCDKIQSDTSNCDPSTIVSTEEIKKEKVEIGKTNWWEREATQFMRGIMVIRNLFSFLIILS